MKKNIIFLSALAFCRMDGDAFNNYPQNLYFAWLYIAGALSGYGITVENNNSLT